jgi:nucleotide-binding universal stress UspA family protein
MAASRTYMGRTIPSISIKYAKEKGVDLIVVGTKGKSGMRKALLGSVASKVVAYSLCLVLVVR